MRLIVDTQGTQLRKEGERLLIHRQGEAAEHDESVPLNILEQVVLSGKGVSATTPLLFDLVQRGIDVVFQSQHERFGFRLVGPHSKHSALRVRQIQVCTTPAAALALARPMIAGKLHNQAILLGHYRDTLGGRGQMALRALVEQQTRAAQAPDAEALRGHEGSGAAAYFAALPELFDAAAWGFHGRAYYPPPDPVNALLSLGYTLLLNDIVSALYRLGLDPMVGVFHALDYGRPSLALDLEEEFRPVIVDLLVLRLLRQQLLTPGDFSTQAGRCTLSDDARRFFIAQYEERLTVQVRHPAWQQQLTYRQCLQRQAEHLARCILGRDAAYTPLLIG